MDYQINYPITQLPGEFIALHYTKGFRSVLAEYKEEVLFEEKKMADLKRGIVVNHPLLGKIEFKFAKEKMVVNVIVEGFHSPINKDHPRQKVKSFATYLWILVGFTGITFFGELFAAIKFPFWQLILLGPVFTALAIMAYIVSALKLRKAKSSFFWLAFGMYLFRFLVYISINSFLFSINGFGIGILLRSIYLIVFLIAIPLMVRYRKYEKFKSGTFSNIELLDDKI